MRDEQDTRGPVVNASEAIAKPEPVTKADFDLRTEYVRLSWRLFRQIGPFNFASQAQLLNQAMALAIIVGKDEEAFVADVAVEAGFAPKEVVA